MEEVIAALRREAERLLPGQRRTFDLIRRSRLERAGRERPALLRRGGDMGGVLAIPWNTMVYVQANRRECAEVVRRLENPILRLRVLNVGRDDDAAELNALGCTEKDLPGTLLNETAVLGFDANRPDAHLAHITL